MVVSAFPHSQTIGKRYTLHEQIGAGGMGTVYRVTDRFTSNQVALKRVNTEGGRLVLDTETDPTNLNLALANEFRTLASLRHPNIVSVLDYGFDGDGYPFFTMDLLEGAQSLLSAAEDRPLDDQLRLLIQLLQALSYLHRRGILHRDLKPGNVMVIDDKVKVLDFGLAVAHEHILDNEEMIVGTISYMAPEILTGGKASEASDLYAVGIIAYELFSGQHPFKSENATQLLHNILTITPDLHILNVQEPLRSIIGRLISKSAVERYSDAQELIDVLAKILNQQAALDTSAIRESFLQAAQFVGREAEMRRLLAALGDAERGRGSGWLVGGESGVGKSRLLDELRIQALVKGVFTARGQAVSEGGSPYQVWRDVLRLLILESNLTDEEASIIKIVLPDVDQLLSRTTPDAAEIDAKQIQPQILKIVSRLLTYIERPALIILEDLHWAGSESLALASQLVQNAADSYLLLVGNFRDDEKPSLPDQVPSMERLKLHRLNEEAIEKLSASMLGEAGKQKQVVSLLQQEAEGNVFFLIEIVRVLAEEAGELRFVGNSTLPQRIYAGGVKTVVERRLSRVPGETRPLLQRAAIAGRKLDTKILQTLAPDLKLDEWLTACSDAAVLDVQDEKWRFAHDKLREALLAELSESERESLHREVAQAIEQVYPDDPAQYATLAHHWSMAGNDQRVQHYAGLAGDQAMLVGANAEAKRFYERAIVALEELPETKTTQRQFVDFTLKLARVAAFNPTDNVMETLKKSLAVAESLSDETLRTQVIASTGAFHYMIGKLGEALGYFRQSIDQAEKLGLEELLVLPYNILGRSMMLSGDWPQAEAILPKGIRLLRHTGEDPELLAGSLAFYAAVLLVQGKWAEAQQHGTESLELAREIALPSRVAGNLMVLGFAHTLAGRFTEAYIYLYECLDIVKDTGDFHPTYMSHGCLGYASLEQEDIEAAKFHLDKAIDMTRGGPLPYVPMFQGVRAEVALRERKWQEAWERAQAALEAAEKALQQTSKAEVLRTLAKIHLSTEKPDWELAETYLQQSIQIHDQYNAQTLAAVSKLELGKLYARKGDEEAARAILQEAQDAFMNLKMTWHFVQARQIYPET